jgi:hypothetical protein
MALTDPSKKDLGGMIVGLVLSQIFRVRFWNVDWLKDLLFLFVFKLFSYEKSLVNRFTITVFLISNTINNLRCNIKYWI